MECWTQLLIGCEAGLINQEAGKELAREAEEVAAMIAGLIRYLRSKES